ncbi:MAG: hypothetical protein AB7E46_05760 [Desulfovibrio sp.]|jgi:hypothetical protein
MTRTAFSRCAALAASLAVLALLGGCWVPQNYIARIKIESDGTYHAYMEGTAVHPEAWLALRRVNAEAKAGRLKEEGQLAAAKAEALAPLAKELEAFKGDKRIQGANSIGDGRVRFSAGGTWVMDRNLLVFNKLDTPISYGVGQDGTVRLKVRAVVPGAEARALGVKTEGSLAVTLAEGIEVLEHNAQQTPTTPRGAYRWSIISGTTEAPYLKLRFPKAEVPAGETPEGQAPRQSPAAATQKKLAHP